ncbi:MAG: DHHA1 domain-containing protein, partial [Planctomycetia bacterium]
ERAAQLAKHLEEENKTRQTLETQVFRSARAQADERYDFADGGGPAALVLAGDDWHPGVIGIVASRMVERYHRPTILVSFREGPVGTGSGRSVRGFPLHAGLDACRPTLVKAGGHAMAAGLRVERGRFDDFRAAFEQYAEEHLTAEQRIAELRIDAEAPLHLLTPALIRSLEVLEPFGLTNPSPLLLAADLTLVDEPKKMGGGDRHLGFKVRQGGAVLRAVAFGMGERCDELTSAAGKCCLVFQPVLNEFRGYQNVELLVKDFFAGSQAPIESVGVGVGS